VTPAGNPPARHDTDLWAPPATWVRFLRPPRGGFTASVKDAYIVFRCRENCIRRLLLPFSNVLPRRSRPRFDTTWVTLEGDALFPIVIRLYTPSIFHTGGSPPSFVRPIEVFPWRSATLGFYDRFSTKFTAFLDWVPSPLSPKRLSGLFYVSGVNDGQLPYNACRFFDRRSRSLWDKTLFLLAGISLAPSL